MKAAIFINGSIMVETIRDFSCILNLMVHSLFNANLADCTWISMEEAMMTALK
jgi:hypothetical protein